MSTTIPFLLASHGGFGLNLNPFETNIINLAIVIVGLWKFLPGFLGSILERRREAILNDLRDAEDRLKSATTALAAAQKDLADAQAKAEQIRTDGKARAQAIRLDSERRTIEEMARVKQGAMADLNAEASRVMDGLRREAASRAIARALEVLPGKLDPQAQEEFLNQSISTMGKV